jgi:hypothetical protein
LSGKKRPVGADAPTGLFVFWEGVGGCFAAIERQEETVFGSVQTAVDLAIAFQIMIL